MDMIRGSRVRGRTAGSAVVSAVAGIMLGIPLLLSGCGNVRPPVQDFKPTLLVISPDAAAGPDYVARGSIDRAGEEDYFELVLGIDFNTVVVMTSGDTDTAGRVETEQRTPITTECAGERHTAVPPCVWGYDDDIDTPNPDRTSKFNTMPASKDFLWEGSLDAGTWYIRVTGQNGATGPYELAVETTNMQCPPKPGDPFGYYCLDE